MLDQGALALAVEDEIDAFLEGKSAEFRKADRRYWTPIIDELRQFRRAGVLMTEGNVV